MADYGTVLLAGLSIWLLYRFYQKFQTRYQYWKKQGVPGPKPTIPFGNLMQSFTSTMHDVYFDFQRKYGKVFGTYEGLKPCLTIADPELIKHIMVKDAQLFINRRPAADVMDEINANGLSLLRGDKWRTVRSILSPTFTSGKMRKMIGHMERAAQDAVHALKSKIEAAENVVDLKDFAGRYTLDVIGSCCFALRPKSHETQSSAFLEHSKNIIKFRFWMVFLMMMPGWMSRLIARNLPNKHMDFFIQLCLQLIKQRRGNAVKANDFLQMLCDINQGKAIENDGDETTKDSEAHHMHEEQKTVSSVANINQPKGILKTRKALNDVETVAAAVQFIAAGYETTASLLGFVFYELAMNSRVQEQLYKELKQITINYDSLTSNAYLDAVVSEALRKYPTLVVIDREAEVDYKLPNRNVTIPKGSLALIPVWNLHYDPQNFAHPEEFKPERFLPEHRDKIKPYTYLPFGAGPRNCIGMRFALLETKLLIAQLVLHFRFKKCAKTPERVTFEKASPILRSEPVYALCEAR